MSVTIATETLLVESSPKRVSIEFKYQYHENHLHCTGIDAETSETDFLNSAQIKAKLSAGLDELTL